MKPGQENISSKSDYDNISDHREMFEEIDLSFSGLGIREKLIEQYGIEKGEKILCHKIFHQAKGTNRWFKYSHEDWNDDWQDNYYEL